VGSIGVEGSDLTIGTGDTGLQFRDASDAIRPFNLSTNSVRDASIDLGRSTGPERFRNLFLSGTAYVDTAVEIHAGNSLKLQNVAGSGFATIQNSGAGTNTDLAFSTAGSERMRIDSSGNIGIGLSSNIGATLHVDPAANVTTTFGTPLIKVGGANSWAGNGSIYSIGFGYNNGSTVKSPAEIGFDTTSATGVTKGDLVFATRDVTTDTAPTERMRISSSGNVGIGTANPAYPLQVEKSTDTNAASGTGVIKIRGGASTYSGAIGMDATGMSIGTDSGVRALMLVAGGSERMRINAGGDVLFGCTSLPSSSVGGAGFEDATSNRMILKLASTTTSNTNLVLIFNPNGNVGSITTSGSSTSFNTSSDYRLKTDAQPMTGATDRLKQLNPVNFEWIADGTRVDGFLAHEAQAVVPEAVTGTHNEVDADGNPVYQGIDQSKLVPLLVATIKELEARITALENA
jgi:hypothetical protein